MDNQNAKKFTKWVAKYLAKKEFAGYPTFVLVQLLTDCREYALREAAKACTDDTAERISRTLSNHLCPPNPMTLLRE